MSGIFGNPFAGLLYLTEEEMRLEEVMAARRQVCRSEVNWYGVHID